MLGKFNRPPLSTKVKSQPSKASHQLPQTPHGEEETVTQGGSELIPLSMDDADQAIPMPLFHPMSVNTNTEG